MLVVLSQPGAAAFATANDNTHDRAPIVCDLASFLNKPRLEQKQKILARLGYPPIVMPPH